MPSTKVNGLVISAMDMASSAGPITLSTMASGLMTKLMDMVNCITQMATYMKVTGLTIRPMVKEHTFMLMVLATWVPGKTINRMGLVRRRGLTALCIKETTTKVRSMDKVNSLSLIHQYMRVNSV